MENEKKNLQSNQNKIGSQVSPVNRFGIPSIDKKESSNIKERLDETRAKNLNSGSVNLDSGLPNNRNLGLDKKPGLQDKNNGLNGNDSISSSSDNRKSKTTGSRSSNNEVSSIGANSVSGGSGASTENGIGNVKSNDNGLTNKNGDSLGLNLGKTLGNTALNVAANNNEAANKAVKTARDVSSSVKFTKRLAKVGKAIAAFFATPLGIVVGFLLGIVGLFVIILVIIATIVNGLGSKFGLTGNEVIEVFNGNCPEGYSEKQCEELRKEYQWAEGMTREEVEELMKKKEGAMCELGFFASVRNFFGIYDLTDNCELAHYVKKLLEDKESETKIDSIDPGYFMGTLYYSFDTQNYDEDGNPYLVPENYDPENPDTVTDLDAITTLFSVKPPLYNTNEIDDIKSIKTLLNSYIYVEDHRIKPYYNWERVCRMVNGVRVCQYECVAHTDVYYYKDVLKFKLYLRYGMGIRNQYENDRLINDTYAKTHANCKALVDPPVSMEKYETKADPSTLTDDNAKIDGIGYDSGFIYTTFPRYNPKYTPGNIETYDYKTDKDIEQIIENIDSRQDYTNYVLGYPSSVKTNYSTPGGNIIAGGINSICSYNVDGVDYSNIKVRLLHGYSPYAGVNRFDPIEGEELVDFETYVLGVVYGEVGGFDAEVLKTQAIAARSYALARVKAMSGLSLTQENGQWILTIRNSNEDQAYCNPDKGCYICDYGGSTTMFSNGNQPNDSEHCRFWKGALPKDHMIRSAVKEVSGMVLVNSQNKPVHASYINTTQRGWQELALAGNDYVEILRKTYANATIATNNCTMSSNGWSMPVEGGITKVSSCFGNRIDPITHKPASHNGTDIPKPMNDPIYAIADGTVYAVVPWKDSYGNYVMIDHGNGYMSLYAHMNKFVDGIKVGDKVSAGQQIGFVGTTGRSTGPHLHLEIRINGKRVDALEVMGVTGFCGR